MAGNELGFKADGEPLAFCSVHSRRKFEAARAAMTQGHDPEQQGGDGDDGEDTPPAEQRPLTEYELQRQDNLRRIEAAKKAIFSSG